MVIKIDEFVREQRIKQNSILKRMISTMENYFVTNSKELGKLLIDGKSIQVPLNHKAHNVYIDEATKILEEINPDYRIQPTRSKYIRKSECDGFLIWRRR